MKRREPSAGAGEHRHRHRLRDAALAWLAGAALALPLPGQQTVGGSITGGWKLPQYDDANRLRSLISGRSVHALPGTTTLRVEALRLEFFGEDGALEFTAEAPDCMFDLGTRVASSAGPLHARTADQRLVISGTGFLAQPATSTLWLSNDVHALVRPGTNPPAAILAPVPVAGPRAEGTPLEIRAAALEINLTNRAAVFREGVRAHDPRLELTGGRLTARFTATNGTLDVIEAEQDVVLVDRAGDSRVTAQHARYTLTNDTLLLSGSPHFRQRDRQGQAAGVRYHRTSSTLEAEGGVELRAPHETLRGAGFLLSMLGETNTVTTTTTISNTPPPPVRISSHRLVSRTNLTVLEGDVRVVDGSNRLSTARLTLESEGTNRAPARIRAENGVVVEQGARLVKAQTGIYERVSDSVRFDGRPQWRLDDLEGVADSLRVFPRTNALEAAGDVRLHLRRLGGVGALLPVFTNAAPVPARTNPPVEVTAQTLVLTNDVLALAGGVTGRELPATGAEKRFQAALVVIELAPGGRRARGFSARGDVVVEQGRPGVTNGPAAWRRFEAGTVRATLSPETGALQSLTAHDGVRVQQPGGWAAGGQAHYSAPTDVVALSGQPTAQFADVRVTEAQALLWHRGSNTIEVMAPYQLQVLPRAAGGPTNTVPKLFFR